MNLSSKVKVNVFLKYINNLAKANEVYAKHFKESFPDKFCVQMAKLTRDAFIEIKVIAKK